MARLLKQRIKLCQTKEDHEVTKPKYNPGFWIHPGLEKNGSYRINEI